MFADEKRDCIPDSTNGRNTRCSNLLTKMTDSLFISFLSTYLSVNSWVQSLVCPLSAIEIHYIGFRIGDTYDANSPNSIHETGSSIDIVCFVSCH